MIFPKEGRLIHETKLPSSGLFSRIAQTKDISSNDNTSQGHSQDFEEGGAIMTKEGAKRLIFSRAAPKFGLSEATPLINDVIINSWAWPNLLFA